MKFSPVLIAAALALITTTQAFSADDYSSLFDTPAAGSSSSIASKAASTTGAGGGLNMELSGSHTFQYAYPLTTNNTYDGLKAPYFSSDLGVEVRDRAVKLVSRWNLGLTVGSNTTLDDSLTIKPLENYIAWTPEKFKLAAGYQVFSWGVADLQNPMDNLNPRDYTLDFKSYKIPVLSGAATWYPIEQLSLEAVFIPYREEFIFPVNVADEIPADLFYQKQVYALDFSYSNIIHDKKTTTVTPDFNIKSAIAGGKLNFFFPAADFSLSYLYDLDPYFTPIVTMEKYLIAVPDFGPAFQNAVGSAYRVAGIDLVHNRLHRIGADAKTTLDRFGLWAEGCLTLTEDLDGTNDAARNNNLAWTAGLDFNWGPDDQFYVNLQYTGKWVMNYDSGFYTDYTNGLPDNSKAGDEAYMQRFYNRAFTQRLGGETEGLLHGITMRAEFKLFDEMLTPKLSAAILIPTFYDTVEKTRNLSYLLNPELDFKPLDSLHILAGAWLFYADQQLKDQQVWSINASDILGRFYGENCFYLQMSYKWSFTGQN